MSRSVVAAAAASAASNAKGVAAAMIREALRGLPREAQLVLLRLSWGQIGHGELSAGWTLNHASNFTHPALPDGWEYWQGREGGSFCIGNIRYGAGRAITEICGPVLRPAKDRWDSTDRVKGAEARFEEQKAHIDAYLCGLNDRLAIAIAQVDIDVARCGQTLGGTWFELCVAQKDVEGALEALKAMMPVDSDDIPSVGRARKLLEEAAKVGPNGASARIDAAVKTAAEVGGRPHILYSDAMEARRCLGCGGNVGRLTVAENKEYVTDGLCLSCRREATATVDNGCMVCGRRCGPGTYCGCQD